MIKDYIVSRKGQFFLLLAVIVIFPLVFFLYGIDEGAAWYSILICTFIFACYSVADFLYFCSKVKKLREIANNLSEISHNLPAPSDVQAVEYERIINQLYEIIADTTNKLNSEHMDRIEYYTMWLHQIKTPISAIRLVLQSSGVQSAQCEQELFKIERYVEMALQYVKMSDIASDLVIEEYKLGQIVGQSLKKYATLFIYSKLSVEIEGTDQVVTTDSKWCSFILEQLLSNAAKYTPSGGTIKIILSPNRLDVQDSGIGILEQDIERVFEKGYTGYNGRLDKRASGIGLYMVRKIADVLSIGLDLHSAKGCGTTVSLLFPHNG